jgi:uncharacterized protein (TIGR03000 family)
LVDGQVAPPPASDVNGVKTYRTPDLPANRTFTYTFSVEMMIDGKPARADKVVYFRAGEPVSLDFTPAVKVAGISP